jgi:hypothetical protein
MAIVITLLMLRAFLLLHDRTNHMNENGFLMLPFTTELEVTTQVIIRTIPG